MVSTTNKEGILIDLTPSASIVNSIYCTILLVGLLVSTCYWDLTPASLSLSTASTNSTSFSTYASNERISRCWCDLNGGHLLRPLSFDNSSSYGSHRHANVNSTANGYTNLQRTAADTFTSWLAEIVQSISKGFTETTLGFKLEL